MTRTATALLIAASLALSNTIIAAGPKTYQVTGTVVEVTATKIVVQKGTERWELDVGPETKGSGGSFKAGDKVTISYTMAATKIDSKSGSDKPDTQKKE